MKVAGRTSSKLAIDWFEMETTFEGFGMCNGKTISPTQIASTLLPGQRSTTGYTVIYQRDDNTQEFEEHEIQQLVIIKDLPESQATFKLYWIPCLR